MCSTYIAVTDRNDNDITDKVELTVTDSSGKTVSAAADGSYKLYPGSKAVVGITFRNSSVSRIYDKEHMKDALISWKTEGSGDEQRSVITISSGSDVLREPVSSSVTRHINDSTGDVVKKAGCDTDGSSEKIAVTKSEGGYTKQVCNACGDVRITDTVLHRQKLQTS